MKRKRKHKFILQVQITVESIDEVSRTAAEKFVRKSWYVKHGSISMPSGVFENMRAEIKSAKILKPDAEG